MQRSGTATNAQLVSRYHIGAVSTLGAVLRILGKISRVRYASTVIASVTPILVEVELPGNVIDLEMVTR